MLPVARATEVLEPGKLPQIIAKGAQHNIVASIAVDIGKQSAGRPLQVGQQGARRILGAFFAQEYYFSVLFIGRKDVADQSDVKSLRTDGQADWRTLDWHSRKHLT